MVGDMHNMFGKWLKVEDKNKVFQKRLNCWGQE